MNKKGNVNKLTGFALLLVVLTLVLAIGLQVMGTMRDTGRTTASAFDSESNFTALNSTAVSFNSGDQLTCSGVVLHNASGVVLTPQFTVSGCSATLNNNTHNNTLFSANYTYTYYQYDAQYNATASNITHVGTIPGWIPIIIVAMIGGIVLFLVIRQFGGGR